MTTFELCNVIDIQKLQNDIEILISLRVVNEFRNNLYAKTIIQISYTCK